MSLESQVGVNAVDDEAVLISDQPSLTLFARTLHDTLSRIEDRRGEARGTMNGVRKHNRRQSTHDDSGRAALNGPYDKNDKDEAESLTVTV